MKWLLPLLLACAFPVHAAEVMFAEADYPSGERVGQLIQLEPGGRFYHVAVRYQGQWLHAYPPKGVMLIDNIDDYGDRFFVMRNDEWPDPDPRFVEQWLGKGFDREYRWESSEVTYCTRLVAEALGVPPEPMSFLSSHWDKSLPWPEGELGLSPDKLYKLLLLRGFKMVHQNLSCAAEMAAR